MRVSRAWAKRPLIKVEIRINGQCCAPHNCLTKKKFPYLQRFATQLSQRSKESCALSNNGSTQTLAGIIGGLVGTFLDGRYYSALAILISLALYRSKALDRVRTIWVLPIHGLSVAIVAFGLFHMGISLNKTRPQTYVPSQYADAVKTKLPIPIVQQITNIYNSYMPSDKKIGEPRIDFEGFRVTNPDSKGSIEFQTVAVNNGSVPALDVKGSAQGIVTVYSPESVDSIFRYLHERAKDLIQPTHDQPPGKAYGMNEIVDLPPLSMGDQADYSLGRRVIVIARLDTYKDSNGHEYESEICMYMQQNYPSLKFCGSHNLSRKLSGS